MAQPGKVEHTANDDRKVYPIHPALDLVEGHQAFTSVETLPEVPEALSIITPAAVTEKLVNQAIAVGIKQIWMQPGAEHAGAIAAAKAAGITVLAYGPCILVDLEN